MVPEAVFADEAVPEAVPEGEAVPRDALEDKAVPEAVPVVEPVPEEPLPGAALPQPESKLTARRIAISKDRIFLFFTCASFLTSR